MMKKYILLLILPLLLFVTIPNVYADGDDAPWPKVFQITDENLQYLIEGISLDIYQTDKNSEQITVEVNEGTSHGTITMSKDEQNYINKVKTKTIELSPTEFSISPVYKKDLFLDIPSTLYIDIDLNLTKEKLQTLLAEEIQNTTADKHYIIDVNVKYQLQNYPEAYGYAYQLDYLRELVGAGLSHTLPTLTKNTSYTQAINRAVTSINEQTNEKSLDYEPNYNGTSDVLLIADLVVLSKNKIEKAGELDGDNADKVLGIMFHDMNNVDELIAAMKSSETPTTNPTTDPGNNPITSYQPNEVVKAEDTAAFASYYIYIIGGLFLIIGVGLFSKILFKKNSIN